MDLEKLVGEVETVVNEHGGASALEKDATQLEGIVTGSGSLISKAEQAEKVIQTAAETTTPPKP